MKSIAILLLSLWTCTMSISQSYDYTLDVTSFFIVDQNTGDTLLISSSDNNLKTNGSIRIASNTSGGSIRLQSFNNPQINLVDENKKKNVEILSSLNGSGGAILLSNKMNGDTNSIRLVTNYASTNDARIITDELQINGGADLAEMFDITNSAALIKPGLLVSLDEQHPGKLELTAKAYDKNIAGIVAGANGVKPGILMGQEGSATYGEDLVTLSGRTYVMANTTAGNIKVGDALTSSPVQGQAMKARHRKKARGAIIGKAMTPLDKDQGYVLVLVNLQ